MKNSKLVVCCALAFLFANQASGEPQRVEAYGDSITAAFLSSTNVTQAPPLHELSGIISDLAMYLMTKQPHHAAKHHAPDKAWPVVLTRALSLDPAAALKNYAVSGARTWQILSQVKSQAPVSAPTLALFFVGHNDLCNSADTAENIGRAYTREMLQNLREWDQRHHNSTAYLLPVSDIHRVFERLAGYVWRRGSQNNYICEDSWTKFFPFCPSHYHKLKAGQLDAYMKPRLEKMNTGLERLATEMTLTSSSNRFVYLRDTHDAAYEPEYFAVDCFHLSATGQELIADRVLGQHSFEQAQIPSLAQQGP